MLLFPPSSPLASAKFELLSLVPLAWLLLSLCCSAARLAVRGPSSRHTTPRDRFDAFVDARLVSSSSSSCFFFSDNAFRCIALLPSQTISLGKQRIHPKASFKVSKCLVAATGNRRSIPRWTPLQLSAASRPRPSPGLARLDRHHYCSSTADKASRRSLRFNRERCFLCKHRAFLHLIAAPPEPAWHANALLQPNACPPYPSFVITIVANFTSIIRSYFSRLLRLHRLASPH